MAVLITGLAKYLRHNSSVWYDTEITAHINHSRSSLDRYSFLTGNEREKQAIENLHLVFYRHATINVKLDIEKGVTSEDIDRKVKIDDSDAFQALDALETANIAVGQKPIKIGLVNGIRRFLGHGGMVHQFKNYILRKEPKLSMIVLHKISQTK